jgi:hypothetical protein
MYRLTSGFCQQWIETRKAAPARRPGTKQVTVGSRSGFVCIAWHSMSLVSAMDRQATGSRMRLLTGILYNRARCFELLERNLAKIGEQENVPVLVTHFDESNRLVLSSGNKKGRK